MTLHEIGVDDGAVPGNERRVGSACVEHPAQRRRPGPQVRVSIEDGVAGLLDEVAAEDDGRLGVRHDDDQVVTGMPTAGVADRRRLAAEIEFRMADRMLGRPKRRDGVRHLVWVGTVAHRIGTQTFGSIRDRRRHLGCAIHGSAR